MSLPEAYGGSELPLVYLGLVLQEVGRALAPLPLHSTGSASLTIAESGSAAQREAILPRVASGELIMTMATEETGLEAGPGAVRLEAKPSGEGFVLNGRKNFVDNFTASHFMLVTCRTAEPTPVSDGVSLFLVDTGTPGVSGVDLTTTAKDGQSEVRFDDVDLSAENLVGPLHGGWPIAERMIERATALLCAQLLGATRKDVELAIDYAKEREAFGQPIGAFQSIQHMCADMIIWADGGDLLTFEALWKIDQGLPHQVEVSQAKSFCNEKCLAAARNSQIIHGGIGFMQEFDIQLWYRRIASWTMRLGTTHMHRARIAQALLDHEGRVVLGQPLPGVETSEGEVEVRRTA